MKAAIYNRYGGPEVVQIKEIEKPQIKEDEVLVEVFYSSVTIADSRLRGSIFPPGFSILGRLAIGIFAPRKKVLGSTFSGKIVSTGKDVKAFEVGDNVLGLVSSTFGAHAEFIAVKETKAIIKKPSNMSFEDAAAFSFGGSTALHFVRDVAKVSKNKSVLVNGASGSVGTNIVQIAKYYGAEVVAVCSEKNKDLVLSLGAKRVIDYKKQNLNEDTEKFDYIFDVVGNLNLNQTKTLLKQNGKIVLIVSSLLQTLKASIGIDKSLLAGITPEKKEDLEFLVNLIVQGKLKVINDETYSLDNITEAYRKVDSGHKVGNILVKISDKNPHA